MSKRGVYELPGRRSGPLVLVASVGGAAGSRAVAAASACTGSEPDRAGLLIDLAEGRVPRPTLIATAGAKALEERVTAHLTRAAVAARGAICQIAAAGAESGGGDDSLLDTAATAMPAARDSVAVVHLPPRLLQPALADSRFRPTAALLRADLAVDRSLTALVAKDLIDRGLRVAVVKRPLGRPRERLALLGALPTGLLPDRSPLRRIGEAPTFDLKGTDRPRAM